jgi:hypothetical protein
MGERVGAEKCEGNAIMSVISGSVPGHIQHTPRDATERGVALEDLPFGVSKVSGLEGVLPGPLKLRSEIIRSMKTLPEEQ